MEQISEQRKIPFNLVLLPSYIHPPTIDAKVLLTMSTETLRIAGVPEAFNDPFDSVVADFPGVVPVQFVAHPGGSGAMLSSLEKGEVDAAFVLTDCAVAAISRQVPIRMVSQIVASPLVWGVVSKSPAPSDVDKHKHKNKLPWAVSRHGSGSDVMLKVYTGAAKSAGVSSTKVCGNFNAMVHSVLSDETRGFLWESSTTRGLLRNMNIQGVDSLRIVDTVTTPWSAFVCVVPMNSSKIDRVKHAVRKFLTAAHKWKSDADTANNISRKYGMTPPEAAEWVAAVQFADVSADFDMNMLESTRKTLVDANVISSENAALNLREFIL